MYLSQLILNPRSRRARRDLANCHDLHRTILRAFPQVEDRAANAREQFGILYRVESMPRTGRLSVLVQSRISPDWSALDAIDPHYLLNAGGACKSIATAYDRVQAGDEFVFRLRANPTRRIHEKADDPLAGKRVELQREEEQIGWLQRKAEGGGFALQTVHAMREDAGAVERLFDREVERGKGIVDIRPIPETKARGRKNGDKLRFGSVLFEGRLRVTDPDLFRQALEQGIGSGKAYGFGLLSIASAGGGW
ncbi:type I-E CRISPR-associated protein Cas6/Cse3/CasE [Nitrolancea hollandica]|uniref:CRISPR-associated protein, Cse3 family n=1 Tax=Nitrolancea hollandica Lb TaxID=1129897 RepID=I4EM57_9BACT|nr:type I-E CRISPR-associated protein Cas6/Cse3/CasE [Nitrolancea hollandica]CCF85770.1 CRISPR-associated protein, Cse3 family [Nitrolancea hollandica Lb]